MKNKTKFSLFVFFPSLVASLFFALAVAAQPVTVADEDEAIRKLAAEHKIPLLGLGVIADGRLARVKMFGKTKSGADAAPGTIFNVASLTKPVVALVALKLASAGKFDLDEPLDKYWIDPDVKDDPRHRLLTARIVLSHRTGFANWRWMNASKKLEFAAEPGAKYGYSGEGFEYLRRALESKFRQPLEKLAKETVFAPLEMRDTRFFWDDAMNETRYAENFDAEGKPYPTRRHTKANAADDLLTTVEDYGKFLLSVMRGEGLTPKVFAEMTGCQAQTKKNKCFGLGWEIYDLGAGEYALSHGGSDEGVKTLVFLLPKSKEGLIIFTSSDNGVKVYLELIGRFLKDRGKRMIEIEMKENQ